MTPLEHTELLEALREIREDFREDIRNVMASIDRLRTDFNGRTGKVEHTAGQLAERVGRLEVWKARLEGVAFAHRWIIPVISAMAGGVIAPIVILVVSHGRLG